MFYIVCVSTERSSVRVGCANATEAQAKVAEFEDTGIGKVRIFDDAGKRIDKDELRSLIDQGVGDERSADADTAAIAANDPSPPK